VAGGVYYYASWDRALNRKDWRRTASDDTTRFLKPLAHPINTDESAEYNIDSILISATTTCLLCVRTIDD
jgi:hypothetical protein